jgi:hypothetical protein
MDAGMEQKQDLDDNQEDAEDNQAKDDDRQPEKKFKKSFHII